MIAVRDLTIGSGSFSVSDLTFGLDLGSYTVLMGRTGSGKTTLLETLAGLRPTTKGTVSIDGRDVTAARPGDRGLGYVPQDGALFPTMTVAEHLSLPMRARRYPREKMRIRVEELVDRFHLGGIYNRKPSFLSGGERQRVALGRAMAADPSVLLLDEPLSALDEESREEMYQVLRGVREPRTVTVLHVTHAGEDARQLSDRVIQITKGRLEDSP